MILRTALFSLFLSLTAWAGPARVVSQTVGTDELLLAVAQPSEIAALSHLARDGNFSGVAEQAKNYPNLEANADAEAVLAFRPTLVLLADYSRADLRKQLERSGTRLIVFDKYATLADCYANLRKLGAALGPISQARAEAVIESCERRVTALSQRLAGVTPVRVIAPSVYGYIPGSETTFEDLCLAAGAENLGRTLGHLVGHAPQPSESMLTWPVERLVIGEEDVAAALEKLRSVPPYRYMNSVKEGRTVILHPWQMSCVSHLRVEAYETLARQLHPERFP